MKCKKETNMLSVWQILPIECHDNPILPIHAFDFINWAEKVYCWHAKHEEPKVRILRIISVQVHHVQEA